MLEQALFNILAKLCTVIVQALERWWMPSLIFFIIGGLLMLAIGSIRWWAVRKWQGKALWKSERDAYEVELKECHDYIHKLETSMHVYMELAHVRAVKNVKDVDV